MTLPTNPFLDLLIKVTQSITSSLEPNEVFSLITRKIPELMGADAATIRLLDTAGKNLILKSSHGLSEEYLNRGTIDSEQPIFKALEGESIFIQDAHSDQRVKFPEATRKEGICGILVVPISIRGKITGVLRLLTKSPRTFTPDEIKFVSSLAEQCGIAIENARIYKEQQTQLDYFKAIHEIGKAINATYDLDQILNLIVKRLPTVMNLKAATIRLIEMHKRTLTLKASYGLSQEYLKRGPLDEELATYYVSKGEPVIIPDATKDMHTIYHKEAEAEGIRGILSVPILLQDDIIGILRLLSSEVRYFSATDISFAMVIAEQVGIAIQRNMGHDKIQATNSF
jgi:GAF domain-containing protein